MTASDELIAEIKAAMAAPLTAASYARRGELLNADNVNALLARLDRAAVAVKPLEWPTDRAVTPFGHYHYKTDERDGATTLFFAKEYLDKIYASVGEAKAAAQVHYEQRIRSALATHPIPQGEAEPTRIEQLERLVRSFVIDEIDYMTINNIGGDPEKKHNIRWARKLGITDTVPHANTRPLGETGDTDELVEALKWIADATKMITEVVGGGSELFVRKGEVFRADLPYCRDRIRERQTRGHEYMLRSAKAESSLAAEKQRNAELERENSDLLTVIAGKPPSALEKQLVERIAERDDIAFRNEANKTLAAQADNDRDEYASASAAAEAKLESAEARVVELEHECLLSMQTIADERKLAEALRNQQNDLIKRLDGQGKELIVTRNLLEEARAALADQPGAQKEGGQ